jgi:hypothetical protein
VWAFTLALLTCLGIDFSNPLLPGVVRFGEEDSVNALRAERPRTDGRPARLLPRPAESTRSIDVPVTPPRRMTAILDHPGPRPATGRARSSIATARAAPAAAEDD